MADILSHSNPVTPTITTDDEGFTTVSATPQAPTPPPEAPETPTAVDAAPADTAPPSPQPPIKAETPEKVAKPDDEKINHPRTNALRKQIDKLVWEKNETAREVERLRAERARLATPARTEPPRQSAIEKPAPAPAALKRPVFSDFEGKSEQPWKDYEAAVIDYEAKREAEIVAQLEDRTLKSVRAKLEREQAERAEADRQAAYDARLEKARALHPDFDDVVENLADPDETPVTPFLRDLIEQHADGPELLYHLASHRDEAKTLATLPFTVAVFKFALRHSSDLPGLMSHFATHPDEVHRLRSLTGEEQFVALGQLTARLDGARTASPVLVPKIKAPAPIQPVGGTRTSAPHDLTNPADLDLEKFIEVENKREFANHRGPRY